MELYEYEYKKLENRFLENIKSYKAQLDILDRLVFIPNKDGSFPANLSGRNFAIKDGVEDKKYHEYYKGGQYRFIVKKGNKEIAYSINLYTDNSWYAGHEKTLKLYVDGVGNDFGLSHLEKISSLEELQEKINKTVDHIKDNLSREEQRLKALPKVHKKLQAALKDTMGLERYHIRDLIG